MPKKKGAKPKVKSYKSATKRFKVTNGGDVKKGKILTRAINRNHRMISKDRARILAGKKASELSDVHVKYRFYLRNS